MDQHAQTVVIPWAWMVPRVAASAARAYLGVGQVERAADWAARLDASGAHDLASIAEFQRTTAARLLVARGQAARGLATLDEMIPPAEAIGRWGSVIEMETLRAVALEGLGKREDALAALGRALALAEPEGYVRRFVDEGPPMRALLAARLRRDIAPTYVATLLRAFDEGYTGEETGGREGDRPLFSVPPPPSPLLEPLSERERDVLRLLVAGRSAPEIAEALVVAPSTVRTHLKSIYGKLDAHSRDQAIARARELKLP
jgi:LuxR family maltose regulon positive regulatory protein